jgi:hypothetical protein
MNPILNDMTETPQAGISFKSRMKEMRNQEDIAQIILNLVAAFQKKIKTSVDPESVKARMLIESKRVSAGLMEIYRSHPEIFSISAVRARNRAVGRELEKNQHEREKYRNDDAYRQYKNQKMKEWRNRPGNAEREKLAAIKRRNAPPKTTFEL